MKKALLILMIFSFWNTLAFANNIVEVGREDGINLTPLFIGQEASYLIAGGEESAGEIGFSITAEITRVQSLPEAPVTQKGNSLVINLPVNAKNYEVRIFFRAQKTGLIDAHIRTKLIEATVWLKVLPTNAPLPWDVNWDGALNLLDVESILRAIRYPSDSVGYYRCDINSNNVVDLADLVRVRSKLGLNPYDFNNDSIADISDWAFAQPQPSKVVDLTGDGIFDINDLAIRFKNQNVGVKPAPAKRLITTVTWGRMKYAK